MLHADNPTLPSSGVHLGCAGWNIPREYSRRFPNAGTHLQRYATVFNTTEINSCFYRPHRFTTYERWAASVPEDFRFAVKLPKAITHEARLVGAAPALERFLGETSGLGTKRGPVLIQLPPSFAFDPGPADSFFTELRERHEGDAVFEPRHETWFTDEVELLLRKHRIARVAADPACVPAAAEPGGYERLLYLRLHGSPRAYYSAYSTTTLESVARFVEDKATRGISTWCIFDNTALGAATGDALTVQAHLLSNTPAG
ncbi:MAG TPA: DUF72 domain-containing protein [Gemmatimonadaceae bacterium]